MPPFLSAKAIGGEHVQVPVSWPSSIKPPVSLNPAFTISSKLVYCRVRTGPLGIFKPYNSISYSAVPVTLPVPVNDPPTHAADAPPMLPINTTIVPSATAVPSSVPCGSQGPQGCPSPPPPFMPPEDDLQGGEVFDPVGLPNLIDDLVPDEPSDIEDQMDFSPPISDPPPAQPQPQPGPQPTATSIVQPILKRLGSASALLRKALAAAGVIFPQLRAGVRGKSDLLTTVASCSGMSEDVVHCVSSASYAATTSNAALSVAVKSIAREAQAALSSINEYECEFNSARAAHRRSALSVYVGLQEMEDERLSSHLWDSWGTKVSGFVTDGRAAFASLESMVEALHPAIAQAKVHADSENLQAGIGTGQQHAHVRSSVQFYRDRVSQAVYPGASKSVLDALFFFLLWRRTHGVGRDSMNTLLRFVSQLLPHGSVFPPTLHVAQQVIGCEDWQKYEVHVCCRKSCQGHAWPHVPPDQWHKHKADVCPHCSHARFKSSNVTGMVICNLCPYCSLVMLTLFYPFQERKCTLLTPGTLTSGLTTSFATVSSRTLNGLLCGSGVLSRPSCT